MKKKILVSLLIVVIVFSFSFPVFCATLGGGNGFDYSQIPKENQFNTKLKTPFQNIWATLTIVFQIAAVAGLVFAGIRYMFASAEEKADIKSSMIHLIIGLVIVFCAATVVQIISNVFNEIT